MQAPVSHALYSKVATNATNEATVPNVQEGLAI